MTYLASLDIFSCLVSNVFSFDAAQKASRHGSKRRDGPHLKTNTPASKQTEHRQERINKNKNNSKCVWRNKSWIKRRIKFTTTQCFCTSIERFGYGPQYAWQKITNVDIFSVLKLHTTKLKTRIKSAFVSALFFSSLYRAKWNNPRG